MNKIGIVLITLFIAINAGLFFLLYNGNIPNFSFFNSPATDSESNAEVYEGKITELVPLDTRIEIVLDTETPRIIVDRESGVARMSETGQITELLTADELKVGDNVEVSIEIDDETQAYVYVIYLNED